MVKFGRLTAEIGSTIWGTPANFNWFRVLAALLHASSSGRQLNFAALNRERHLCSAGRPSRWALAHILVVSSSFLPVFVVFFPRSRLSWLYPSAFGRTLVYRKLCIVPFRFGLANLLQSIFASLPIVLITCIGMRSQWVHCFTGLPSALFAFVRVLLCHGNCRRRFLRARRHSYSARITCHRVSVCPSVRLSQVGVRLKRKTAKRIG